MNTSVETIKKRINAINLEIKQCENGVDKLELQNQRKILLDSLHTKKFKSRIADSFRKAKKAEDKKPKKPEQPVKIVYRDIPVEIIKEVPVEVPVEVIIEKEVFVNTGNDGIPTSLETDEFVALLKDVRDTYIKTNTELTLNDYVTTIDGLGRIKSFHIDEEELYSKQGGIFVKLKKIRLSDGKEGQRFLGKDKRGYRVSDITKTTKPKKAKKTT